MRREDEAERLHDMLSYTQECLTEEVQAKEMMVQEMAQLQKQLEEKEEELAELKTRMSSGT